MTGKPCASLAAVWLGLAATLGSAADVAATASARTTEFRTNRLFSDHMVLQRGRPVRVFGVGPDNARVTVSLGRVAAAARVANGEWSATLPALPAGGPHTLIIEGPARIELRDVLVGDVWICAGQSNMRHELKNIPEFMANRDAWARPKVRLLRSAKQQSVAPASEHTPEPGFEQGWQRAMPDGLGNFSATGFYFGEVLQRELDVPIGLIDASVGATNIELWMDATLLRQLNPNLKVPDALSGHRTPTHYYNGMIAPLHRFAIKGVIWYQGEANAGQADVYERYFTGLIRRWRELWGQGDFPFYWAQLASFGGRPQQAWTWLREAQSRARSEPNTGMAVTTDLGDFADIHPKRKREVGERLAALALRAEGREIVAEGPQFARAEFRDDQAIVHFAKVAGGLVAREVVMNRELKFAPGADPNAWRAPADRLVGFMLAGADRKFLPAEARIENGTVIVTSGEVPVPAAVRYAWENFTLANLYDRAGLPAEPFRSDEWPLEGFLRPR